MEQLRRAIDEDNHELMDFELLQTMDESQVRELLDYTMGFQNLVAHCLREALKLKYFEFDLLAGREEQAWNKIQEHNPGDRAFFHGIINKTIKWERKDLLIKILTTYAPDKDLESLSTLNRALEKNPEILSLVYHYSDSSTQMSFSWIFSPIKEVTSLSR